MSPRTTDPDLHLHTLPQGLRLAVLHQPALAMVHASLFIHTGSLHEAPRLPGLAHVVEHMVFKGSARRSAAEINLAAERQGAELNAHTDKDHTALHVRGLARDAAGFIRLLAELALEPAFPDDEIERERQVLLQEFAEVDDDPVHHAWRLADALTWGRHPLARPVIGLRRTLERFGRADLVDHVRRGYTLDRMVLAIASPWAPQRLLKAAEAAFAHAGRAAAEAAGEAAGGGPPRARRGAGVLAGPAEGSGLADPRTAPRPLRRPVNGPAVPACEPAVPAGGGLRTRRLAGHSQAHAVLAFPIPGLAEADPAMELAAVLFGEGMSSPLLAELRERRGLVYHAAALAEVVEGGGQFVVEASMGPAQALEFVDTTLALLAAQTQAIAPEDLERARAQWLVRKLMQRDRPGRRLEAVALPWLVRGAPESWAATRRRMLALEAADLQAAFTRLQAAPAALAFCGQLPRGLGEQAGQALGRHGFRYGGG